MVIQPLIMVISMILCFIKHKNGIKMRMKKKDWKMEGIMIKNINFIRVSDKMKHNKIIQILRILMNLMMFKSLKMVNFNQKFKTQKKV